jgi:hypothetical protein
MILLGNDPCLPRGIAPIEVKPDISSVVLIIYDNLFSHQTQNTPSQSLLHSNTSATVSTYSYLSIKL